MKLLIAEDEKDLAEALSVFLEKNLYTVDTVHNGADAYEYASTGAYDAIILDIMMPKLNGLQVLSRLREDGVATPVMLLTAKGQKDDRIVGFDAGADDYLPKPFAPDELLSVDFDTLQSVNPDIQAWLYMSGSSIHYPVLQAEDNSTYLYRLADGSSNAHGSLFIDCRNAGDFSDWNTLIYGHNMKDGSMFGGLKKYRKQAYYDAHPEMTLFTPEKTYRMEIFAAVTTDVSAAVYRVPAAREERDELVQWAQRNSEIECDVSIGTEDRIVTLSTCTGGDDDRFVVLAVLRET